MSLLRRTLVATASVIGIACGDGTPASTAIPIASLVIAATADSLYVADTLRLIASPFAANGNVLADRAIAWTSSSPATIAVDADGLAHLLAPGTAWIMAASEGVRDSVRLKALARVARVIITPRTFQVVRQYPVTLSATLLDAAGAPITGRPITWHSLAPSVVDVGPGGGAIGRGRGTAQLIAESEGRADTIIVTGRLAVATAVISTVPDTVRVGTSRQLSVMLLDSLGDTLTGVPVTWRSELPLLATVTGSGLVQAIGGGTAAISVTADGAIRGSRSVPVGDVVYAEVQAGYQFACGRTTAGEVLCWSHYNSTGNLGNPAIPSFSGDTLYTPTLTALPQPATALATLYQSHACAIIAGSAPWCWGQNADYQLGEPYGGPCTTVAGGSCVRGPLLVPGNHGFTVISAGNQHTCALAADSTAWCWGSSQRVGAGSQPTFQVPPTAVTGGLHFAALEAGATGTCALTADSAAWCWGSVPALVPGGIHLGTISAGGDFYCGVAAGGAGYCWGVNIAGQLGTGGSTATVSTPTPVAGGLQFTIISAGGGAACGVDLGHSLYCWGRQTSGVHRTTPVLIGTGYASVSTGLELTCATALTGRVYCWNPDVSDTPLLLPGQR